MTKLIAVLIIVIVLFGGWHLFLYWEKVRDEEKTAQKQAASAVVAPEQLSGLPQQYETSLQAAIAASKTQGASALKKWLNAFDRAVQDPRRAWVELDYCLLLSKEDPSEARRVFAAVKERTPPSSPVWPRIKQLEKTYE